ncbi:MAG: hypothetical protein WB507_07495 [Solirubrobacterales bacterium]
MGAKRGGRAAAVGLAALLLATPSAIAKGGNPDFSSVIRQVRPTVAGVDFLSLENGNRMRVIDRHANQVTIYGYEREPYARVLPSGTVQVNLRSPATYLNRYRPADPLVPRFASALAKPRWRTIGRSGKFTWIDQRTHWIGAGVPPQVTDQSRRTKVLNFRIPVRINGNRGAVVGAVFWTGVPGPSTGRLIAAGAIMILAAGALLLISRRRRGHSGGARRGGEPAREAW